MWSIHRNIAYVPVGIKEEERKKKARKKHKGREKGEGKKTFSQEDTNRKCFYFIRGRKEGRLKQAERKKISFPSPDPHAGR